MNSLIIALNILKRALREPGMLVMMIILPIIGGMIAVTSFEKPAAVKLGIAALENSRPALVEAVENTGKYNISFVNENELYTQIKNKNIQLGVIIPQNADEGLKSGNLAGKIKIVTLKYDDKATAFKDILNKYIHNLQTGENQSLVIQPQNESKDIGKPRMALGMLTMFMLMFVGAGMNQILSDKKAKTFMRLFCAPLREYEAVLGKLLANFLLGLIQIIVFLLLATFILGIDWGVPVLYIFILLVFFLLTAIGLGIGITAIISNSQIYTAVNTVLSTMTCMLGGSFFSTTLMKGTLKTISNFIPQKWAMDAFEKLFSGGTFADIQSNLLILILFGAVFFTFGVKTLRPSASDL